MVSFYSYKQAIGKIQTYVQSMKKLFPAKLTVPSDCTVQIISGCSIVYDYSL